MAEQTKEEVRMSGYLEKKGRMKLLPAWKQYWFVLKDQLLLYYRSELDYVNLSVHKGSINMGLASNVRPGLNRPNIIEIITRTQIITLRTKDRSTQEQWLQSMLESMAMLKTGKSNTVPMQMRYSLDNLPTVSKDVQTLDNNDSTAPLSGSKDNILARINRLGGRSYGTGSFESVIQRRSISCRAPSETENDVEGDKRISQDGSCISSEYAYVDNKLYHRSESDDMKNISSGSAVTTNISEDEEDDTYEKLPIGNSKNGLEFENKGSDTVEKELHSTVMKQRNRPPQPEPEPDLPPRSPPSNKQCISDIEEDIEYAECYEDIGYNESKKSGGKEDSKSKKKHSKKFKTKNKEPKQTTVNKEKSSKNGKNSFLKSVFGHYRKKPEPEKISDIPIQEAEDSPEEPAYDTVESTPPEPDELPEAEVLMVTPAKGGCKRSLLPSNALTELQQKLKTYDDHKDTEEYEMSDDVFTVNGAQDEEQTNKSTESIPPSLPPRHSGEMRPNSPWHDVPSNNSPLDSDSGKLILSQEQQDSLLGTPQGFALLKSKWQAAERGGEWNPELHHLNLLAQPAEDMKEEDCTPMQSLSLLYSKVDKKSKTTVDRLDSTEINVKAEGEQLIVPVLPPHDSDSLMNHSIREGHSCGSNMLKAKGDDSKEEDNFQRDSLMSCVSSDKENFFSHDSLQDKPLCSIIPTLRGNGKLGEELTNRNSNDLNILLAQLAEITTAPLLTPGATSSLVNYPHSDITDQLALLGPIRRRRHSEPDYDVPRPHQPLLLRTLPDTERSQHMEKQLTGGHLSEDAISCSLSISPDSLEPVPSH